MNKIFIPVNEPVISKEAKRNVREAISSGWLSSAGPFIKKFEQEFARYLGAKYAISVSSGTAALHVALASLGIGEGDEVIVPAFTMAASWMAVLYSGARPVFVDCELETYNIDSEEIEKKITRRTRAVMPVHIYGHSCEMNKIMSLAKKHKLYVIEDAAEAHGAEYGSKKCGNFGDINCFSFYANKIVTTGEGGMVVTNNKKFAYEANKFKDLYHSDKRRFIHERLGYNYRMTNLQAAVGCGELENVDKYVERKQWMANLYDQGLKDIPGIKIPTTRPGVKNVYWMYGIIIDKEKFGLNRDELRTRLKKEGIDTREFFYPPEDQPILRKKIGNQKFPKAKYLSENGLYLPSGLAITEKQIRKVVSIIRDLKRK